MNLDVLDLDEVKLRWSTVKLLPNEECLEWSRGTDKDGYGLFRLRLGGRAGKFYKFLAHRVAWYYHYGSEPQNLACHTCNNPLCCNVDHLYDGTHKQNMHDRSMAETLHTTRLSINQCLDIRYLYFAERFSQRQLAKMYEVAPSTIHYNIHQRITQ